MNYKYDLSVVIISWKMKELLSNCLASLTKYTSGLKYELILIDNNSQDGTIEMIESEYPDAKFIKNEKNNGVAPARNQGLELVEGKYVLILDADVELTENSFIQLYKLMEENPGYGVCGCKLTDPDGQLQTTCKRFPTLMALFFRRLESFEFIKNSKTLKYHTMRDWDHSEIREVDYLIGACQFIRKSVLEEIGFYDGNIFYGPEDIDFCLRVWRAGFKVVYYPFTKIIHHEQRVTKKNVFSAIAYKHLKGIFYIYMKYKGRLTR